MLAHPREAMRNISLLIHNPKAVGSIVANETWHYCNSSAYHAGVCAGQVAGTVALGALVSDFWWLGFGGWIDGWAV
jgi:hypothetical protein